MVKPLEDKLEEYIQSLPNQEYRIDLENRAELHEQLAAALGAGDSPQKIFQAMMALLQKNRVKRLLNKEQQTIGLCVRQPAKPEPAPTPSLRLGEQDAQHVVFTKCIQALHQEDGKHRDIADVIGELVGPFDELKSYLETLRRIKFYASAGFQRKKYEILDKGRTEITAEELPELFNRQRQSAQPKAEPSPTPSRPAHHQPPSFVEPKPSGTAAEPPASQPAKVTPEPATVKLQSPVKPKGKTAEVEAEPQAQPTTIQTLRQLIEDLADELEQSRKHEDELKNRLRQAKETYEEELNRLHERLKTAEQRLREFEDRSALPSNLSERIARLLGKSSKP